jgi:hypothetical protein
MPTLTNTRAEDGIEVRLHVEARHEIGGMGDDDNADCRVYSGL